MSVQISFFIHKLLIWKRVRVIYNRYLCIKQKRAPSPIQSGAWLHHTFAWQLKIGKSNRIKILPQKWRIYHQPSNSVNPSRALLEMSYTPPSVSECSPWMPRIWRPKSSQILKDLWIDYKGKCIMGFANLLNSGWALIFGNRTWTEARIVVPCSKFLTRRSANNED